MLRAAPLRQTPSGPPLHPLRTPYRRPNGQVLTAASIAPEGNRRPRRLAAPLQIGVSESWRSEGGGCPRGGNAGAMRRVVACSAAPRAQGPSDRPAGQPAAAPRAGGPSDRTQAKRSDRPDSPSVEQLAAALTRPARLETAEAEAILREGRVRFPPPPLRPTSPHRGAARALHFRHTRTGVRYTPVTPRRARVSLPSHQGGR
eukprot:790294-Prorocentrum_minimum.AAC.2